MYQSLIVTGNLIEKLQMISENEASGMLVSSRRWLDQNGQEMEAKAGFVLHYFGKDAEAKCENLEPDMKLLIRGRVVGDEKGNPILRRNGEERLVCYFDINVAAITVLGHVEEGMSDFQGFTVLGNLGRDPEMRYAPTGTAVTNLSLATNYTYKDPQTGDNVKETIWWRAAFWGKQAENANKFLHKGSKVLLEGFLVVDAKTHGPRMWEDRDGDMRASFEISGSTFKMLDSKSESAGNIPYQGEDSFGGSSSSGKDEDEEIPF